MRSAERIQDLRPRSEITRCIVPIAVSEIVSDVADSVLHIWLTHLSVQIGGRQAPNRLSSDRRNILVPDQRPQPPSEVVRRP